MIDATDRRILKVLQEDGRITNQELASRLAMSPSACLDRVRRLREREFILGFTAILDPAKLDCGFLVFVEVLLERTTGDVFRRFADAIRDIPEVQECHMVAGGFDYLLKLRLRDMGLYRRFLVEVLAEIPGVRETRTYAVMEEIKSGGALAI